MLSLSTSKMQCNDLADWLAADCIAAAEACLCALTLHLRLGLDQPNRIHLVVFRLTAYSESPSMQGTSPCAEHMYGKCSDSMCSQIHLRVGFCKRSCQVQPHVTATPCRGSRSGTDHVLHAWTGSCIQREAREGDILTTDITALFVYVLLLIACCSTSQQAKRMNIEARTRP